MGTDTTGVDGFTQGDWGGRGDDSRARQELYRKPKVKGGTELLNKSLVS